MKTSIRYYKTKHYYGTGIADLVLCKTQDGQQLYNIKMTIEDTDTCPQFRHYRGFRGNYTVVPHDNFIGALFNRTVTIDTVVDASTLDHLFKTYYR